MKFEFDQVLKEAFGTEAAKADSAVPGTPYTFANTLEWAVGVQPKKEPSQVIEGTPMAKQFPKEAIQEPSLEEPLLSPLDLVGPGLVKGAAKGVVSVAKTAGQELNKFALQAADIVGTESNSKLLKLSNIVPDVNPKVGKFSFSPTWDKELAAGFLKEEGKRSDDALWMKYKTYRGRDGILRQYDYDGFNTVDLNKLDFERRNNVAFKGKLVDLYASPTMYKSNPALENTKIQITFTPEIDAAQSIGMGASYHNDKNIIKLSIADNFFDHYEMKDLKNQILDAIPHEVTHKNQAFYNTKELKSNFFSFKKKDGTRINEGSAVDYEPISKKDYDMLKGHKKILIDTNTTTEKEASDIVIKNLRDIQSKQYHSNYGEVGAYSSEESRRLTPEQFAIISPLRLEENYLKGNNIKNNDIIYENIQDRIRKEWGSIDNYVKALKDLANFASVKQGAVEKVSEKNYKVYETMVESSDPYGIPTLIPISFKAKSKEDFLKKVESRIGPSFSEVKEVATPGQARKVRKTPRPDSGGEEFINENSPLYVPKYGRYGEEIS